MSSRKMLFEDIEKIANIRTFRSRIQDLTTADMTDLVYVISDRPLFRRLNFGEYNALGELSANTAKCELSEKTITTLRLRCQESLGLPMLARSVLLSISPMCHDVDRGILHVFMCTQ